MYISLVKSCSDFISTGHGLILTNSLDTQNLWEQKYDMKESCDFLWQQANVELGTPWDKDQQVPQSNRINSYTMDPIFCAASSHTAPFATFDNDIPPQVLHPTLFLFQLLLCQINQHSSNFNAQNTMKSYQRPHSFTFTICSP